MKNKLITLTSLFMAILVSSCAHPSDNQGDINHNYMWFDCEANYATLSHPDSIRYYIQKSKDLGFGNVVVDIV